ncbi:AsmA-like C-terminal region-containing protein [Terasakiella sp. SH-1]|uniref:YhdP family protein n=1 Tax=Terasakiella sp. SH-1 TaxID=2560057 RepID=UPI001073A223|nr:AsmA-like C-terminal region-containing protein [Terasakiella sp. SH-1]
MVWKTLKHTLQIVSAVLAGIALLGLVFAWKLSQGPISLPQLTPYIVEAVSKNARGMSVRIDDTILSWEGWDRTLDVRIVGASVFTRDGRRIASVPQASLSLSGKALFEGTVAPRSIELIKPQIHLMRHGDGTFVFEMGDGITVRADKAFRLDELVGKQPDPTRPLSYLKKVIVNKAQLEYQDKKTGTTLRVPNTTFEVERIGETIVLASALEVFLSGKPTKIDLDASYNLTTEILDTQARIHALHLGDLSGLWPELAPLKPLQFSIEGQVSGAVDKEGNVRSFFSDLKATSGQLHLPAPVKQVLNIDTLSLRAGYEDFNAKVRIEEALLALSEGSMIKTPAPIEDFIPMEVMRFKGDYETDKDILHVESLDLDLGEGPTASVKGSIAGLFNGPVRKADLIGELLNVIPGKLNRYWPKGLNDDARDWVVENISDGMVQRAGIDISVSAHENGEVTVHHVHGDMEMDKVTVDYLNPLPKVRDARGWAKFDDKTFKITVTGGGIDKIRIKKAQIDILGLDEYDQRLNLDLVAEGPLRDTLFFIDKKPLGFAKALGIEPKKTSGKTVTNLKMSFLLLDDLGWDGVDVSATAQGTDIVIDDVLFEEDLSKGAIKLSVDKTGMDVEGKIVLGTIPADLKWRENFSRNTLFKRRFLLDGVVNDAQRVKELRLDFPPFNNEIMTGPIHVDATITENWQGIGILETFADLKGAEIHIPIIDWKKVPEGEGQAYAKVNFNSDRLIGVPYFSVASKDLKASGSIALDAKGEQIQTMRISRFQAGRTKVNKGTVLYSPVVGWEFDITGDSLDLMAALDNRRKSESKEAPTNEDTGLPGTFSGRFDKVWLDEDHSLNTVAGAVSSDGKVWTKAHLTGVVGGGEAFTIDLSPDKQNRRLKMETKDAGALLRALDLFDDIQGGNLLIEGVFNDDAPRRPLVGSIRVQDYRITEVPALAKLLSLVALTGVLDSLQGDGIGFTSLTSPFKYDSGVVEFKDGRTNGISIGLTWEGKLYTHANVADIDGTIVPAYGLNALLGNVPLLGNLFTAGEKGGGLFAWTFDVTGDLDDPKVSVNPVSALAPGFLRRLFQLEKPQQDIPAAAQ